MPVRDAPGQPTAVKSAAEASAADNFAANSAAAANNDEKANTKTDKSNDPSMADQITFSCKKWADCACESAGKCGCGDACACGSISVAEMNDFMEKSCGFSNCTCGIGCGCGKACKWYVSISFCPPPFSPLSCLLVNFL